MDIIRTMKRLITLRRVVLHSFLLFGLVIAVPGTAHDVKGPDGKPTHKHVYKANSFGKGTTAGHYAQPAGSNGIVIWQSSSSRSYSKTQPGFKVPDVNSKQQPQKATFTKQKRKAPDLIRK